MTPETIAELREISAGTLTGPQVIKVVKALPDLLNEIARKNKVLKTIRVMTNPDHHKAECECNYCNIRHIADYGLETTE